MPVRNGERVSRNARMNKRNPKLGYYYIVTDTEETEQNYLTGFKEQIPKKIQDMIVIKVKKSKLQNLVEDARQGASLHAQYSEPWIVFDRDQVKNFDEMIHDAQADGIHVAWSNPCIKIWLGAYFKAMPTTKDSVSCCQLFAKIFETNTGKRYDKADKQLYEKLRMFGDERLAIKWATKKLRDHKYDYKEKPSDMNPGTTMHLLIGEILRKIKV